MSNETLTRIAAAEQEAAGILDAARERRAETVANARTEAARRLAMAQETGGEAGKRLAAEIVSSAEAEAERMRTAAAAERAATLDAARQHLAEAAARIVERTVSAGGRP